MAGIRFVAVLLACSLAVPAGGDEPVVVHLAFRDHLVSVHSGQETLYTVRERNGEILSANVDGAQLLATYPELHERLSTAVAGPDSGGFNWAGMHLPGPVEVPIRGTQ